MSANDKNRLLFKHFDGQFGSLRQRAGVDQGEFRDFRRTCLTNWFANGSSEYEVMKMAGHASFETTWSFYLAVRQDLLEQARAASSEAMETISIANPFRVPSEGSTADKVGVVSN